jgi:hypothetical protein
MWAVGWQKKDKQLALCPYLLHILHFCILMHPCIVQYHYRMFCNSKGQPVQVFDDKVCRNGLGGGCMNKIIVSCEHTKTVGMSTSGSCYRNRFILELPTIGHIPFFGDLCFITIEKIYFPVFTALFQQC